MSPARTLALLVAFLFFYQFLPAQLLPVKSGLQADLAKVVSDYPSHFKNLAGELIAENPQSTDYTSLLELKDAEACTVTKFSASGREVYSWQALVLTTENFEEASKKYRSLFHSIQNLSATIGEQKVVFKGTFVKPTESLKFNSVVFDCTGEETWKNLKIEITLQTELLEWVVKILVYEKEREDDERGQIIEQ